MSKFDGVCVSILLLGMVDLMFNDTQFMLEHEGLFWLWGTVLVVMLFKMFWETRPKWPGR